MDTTARLDLTVWRNDDVYEFPIRVIGPDLTGVALAVQIRGERDSSVLLAKLDQATNGNAEGVRLAAVTLVDGRYVNDVRVRINRSTRQGLPYAGEMGDSWIGQWVLVIGGRSRIVGAITMLATAYASDAAPANRPSGYGYATRAAAMPSAGATLTIAADSVAELVIDGADLVGSMVDEARVARDAVKPLFGAGPPAANLGIVGSSYYDTTDPLSPIFYGPKTAAGWGAGRPLKGNPGGNVLAVGLFTDIPALTIPGGTNAIRTSGYEVGGVGNADYIFDPAVDAAYVAANPRTSAISVNGRGWPLIANRNAAAFGARGGRPSGAAIGTGLAMTSAIEVARAEADYVLETPIVVGSGGRLIGTGSPVLRQAGGRNTNLIVNAAYLRAPTIIAGAGAGNNSVNWDPSTPFRLPITWYGHGLKVGDWVWLENTDRTEYSGVFPVIEVGNEANIVVKLDAMPIGNPTGVTKARQADTDIDLDRFIADYDRANNGDGNPGPQTHTILLAGVAGLRCKAKVRNTKKFAICIGAVVDFDIDLTGWNLFSDGLKIYGAAWRGRVRVLGTTGDDMLSFHPREADQFAAYRFSQGSIHDIEATVIAGAGANGVVVMASIYPTTWGGATVRDLDITLKGHCDAPGVNVLDYTGSSTVGAITIHHDARAKFALQIAQVAGTTGTTTVQRVNLDLGSSAWSTNTDPLIRIAPNCKVDHIHLSGRGDGMGNPAAPLLSEGDVGRVTCDPAFHYRTGGSSFAVLSTAAKTLAAIDFGSANIDVSGTMIRADGVALPKGYTISSRAGGRLKAGLNLIEAQSSLALDFQGALYPGQRVFVMYGTNASVTTLTAAPGVLRSGEWATRATGDRLVAPRSFNVNLDIRQAYIQRAAGNYMTMDANTAGTLVAKTMIVCDGAAAGSWHGVANPVAQNY